MITEMNRPLKQVHFQVAKINELQAQLNMKVNEVRWLGERIRDLEEKRSVVLLGDDIIAPRPFRPPPTTLLAFVSTFDVVCII
jgi:hypothetical protein